MGRWGWATAYGQADRKILVFYDSPNYITERMNGLEIFLLVRSVNHSRKDKILWSSISDIHYPSNIHHSVKQ